ncbi:MAG: tetratricopeptide (TPR) repeat protein, partial [Planctomycetota bacterium]
MRPLPIALATCTFLALGLGLWWSGDTAPAQPTEEEAESAREDGRAAAEVGLEQVDGCCPSSLQAARDLLGDDLLDCACEALKARLATVEGTPEEGPVCVMLSEVLRRLGHLKAATKHGRRGAELLPTSSRAHWTHARALVREAGEQGRAGGLALLAAAKKMGPYKSELQLAIDLDPKNVELRKEQALFLLFAPMVGNPTRGLELAHELEALDPIEGGLTVARALSLDEEGLEAALIKAREVEGAHPSSQEPPWVLGCLLHGAKRFDEADEALAKIALGPKGETYYQALHLRARLRNDRGLGFAEALEFLDEFEAASPAWEWTPKEAEVLCERGPAPAGGGPP